MKRILFPLVLCLALAWTQSVSASPAFYFDFDGDAVADPGLTLAIGGAFTADIYVNGITDYYGGIAGAAVDIFYDSALVQVTDADLDPGLQGFFGYNVEFPTPESVYFNGTADTPLYDDPLPIGFVSFQSLTAGSFVLAMADPGAPVDSLAAWEGTAIHVYDDDPGGIVYQSAEVSAVPLPGAALLLGSGILGLLGIRRRRN